MPGHKKDSTAATQEHVTHKPLGVEAALVAILRKSVEAKSDRIQDLRDMLQIRDDKLLDLRIRLASIDRSLSWRLTAPLRKLRSLLRGHTRTRPRASECDTTD